MKSFYEKKDNPKEKEDIGIVTMKDSNIHKARKYVKKKFGITILTIEQAIIKMQKEKKNEKNAL